MSARLPIEGFLEWNGEESSELREERALGGPGLRKLWGGLLGSLLDGFVFSTIEVKVVDVEDEGRMPILLQYSFLSENRTRWASHLRRAMAKRKGMSPDRERG